MSLRILLADESTNIKKAFQLSLAEFGAEIRSVPSGLDVISVAETFKPDMIFADVLLTKKSGYEVCRDIKNHASLKNTPVILMWSNFMEFDQKLAVEVQFNDKLEKPFDVDTLKNVVRKYHSDINSHPLQGFTEKPNLPDLEDDFKPISLPTETTPQPRSQLTPNESITAKPAQIELETENFGEFEEVILVKSTEARAAGQDQFTKKVTDQVKSYIDHSPIGKNSHFNDNLVREEVRSMTEKICWQIIPELAEKIIREEIATLMKSLEKNP